MIGLFCFVLAVLASPFRSKLWLEAEKRGGHLFSGLWSLWAFTDFSNDFWRPVSASKNSVPGGRALGLRFLMAAGSKRRYRLDSKI
jgi:hypothetical protein